jgi:hypothetical protein
MRAGRRFCALSRPRDVVALAAALVATLLSPGLLQSLYPPIRLAAQQIGLPVPAGADLHAIPGRLAAMPAPQLVPSAFMTTPQPLTPAQVEMGSLEYDRLSSTWAGRRAAVITADTAGGPRVGTEAVPRELPAGPAPDGADAVVRLLRRVIPLAPSAFGLAVRMVAEPSVAVGDSVTWVTGNWFAARSTDEGATWTYVNPYADFPTFASDQDTIYDAERHAFLWYRQGGLVPGRLENSVRLNVSTDGAASWCSFTLRPSDIDPSWSTLNFDYPHLALSDNYLYVSSMLLVTGAGFATPRMVLLRMPLDQLAGCAAFRYVYWTSDEGWSWTPVENGATTTMYLGDTVEPGGAERTGIFRLYVQPEGTTTLTYVDRSVPAWTFTERTGLCTVSGGGNPCARTDQRITSGWVRQRTGGGEVGFLWNVREGGGFPHPYINAVTFDQDTLAVTGRPMLWDTRCAWQYGAAAPNGPDLGIAAFYFCASQAPAHAVGLADVVDGQPRWSMAYSRIGDVPTSTLVWGDYIRLRAAARGYVATGYTIGANGAEPFLVSFSRRPPGGLDEPPQLSDQNPR